MAIPSGLSAQVGVAEEVTWGTVVTPNRFFPFLSESLSQDIERIESDGIIAGARLRRSTQWEPGAKTVSGDLNLEVNTRNVGVLLKHALGSVVTTGPVSSLYTHVITPGDLGGKGLTVQVGRPDTTGTVRAFTYRGCKVGTWEISLAAGELAKMTLGLVGKDEVTNVALATASLPANMRSFSYTGGGVYLGGGATPVAACVRSITISGDNSLVTDRTCIGHDYVDEPLEGELRNITGEVEMEFKGLTEYNRYVASEEFNISLDLAAGTTYLSIDMNARYDGATPNVDGRGLIVVSMPFTVVGSTDDASGFRAELANADSAA